MAGTVSRESYFETGLAVLSDLGYGGLKLAGVCHRLGVTTGSFYHYFPSWSAYTRALLEYWDEARAASIATICAQSDPRRRIDAFIQTALELPHSAEAAIRVWSSIDPEVESVQVAVDQRRFDVLLEAACAILDDKHQARVFASSAMYILIGYEQSRLPLASKDLAWIGAQLLEALDSGRFSSVPDIS
ncbi:TetR/AcrR family transcriptional regulator [Mycolicibacterium hodleri]|uniref:TetR/AcrR family transcriptional regulator n=1 Tax=Mycolicibacterium hodleri TaxID=49897 RepID=A0A502EFN9_9MYCO|nr:TetR/AcrR family transcriptional regulator [Mycolicibacterium hodleri]TPG35296.1 TetR/AcrR family transcriptional regulator [Mycolicibacterium hodleri]